MIKEIKIDKNIVDKTLEGNIWRVIIFYKGKQFTFNYRTEEDRDINIMDCLGYLFNIVYKKYNYKNIFNKKEEIEKELEVDKKYIENIKRLFGKDLSLIHKEYLSERNVKNGK